MSNRDLRLDHTYDLANAIPRYGIDLPPGLDAALVSDIEQLATALNLPSEYRLNRTPRAIAGWLADREKHGWLIQAATPDYSSGRADWSRPIHLWIYAQSYTQAVRKAQRWADEMTNDKERMAA